LEVVREAEGRTDLDLEEVVEEGDSNFDDSYGTFDLDTPFERMEARMTGG
jgi:hypothetical protein